MCIWRNSSYELDTFAPYLLHKLAIVEVPLHLLAAYIVIFKTPSRMASVKWMMVFLHFCSAFLDLFIAILSAQYYLVPIVGGYMRGIFTDIGISSDIQAHLFITSIGIVGMSILGFFESRYNIVVKGNHENIFKTKGRLFYMGTHYLFALLFTLLTLPCVPESIIDDPVFHLWLEEPFIYAVYYGVTALVISLEVIYYFVRTALYLSSTKAKSQKTHKLQVQFFIAWTIQIAIPLVIVIFPIAYLIIAFITFHFDQMYNNLALNFIALHGVASSSVMLIVHKPYREAVAKLLRFNLIWARCHRRPENAVGDASLMAVSIIVDIQLDRRSAFLDLFIAVFSTQYYLVPIVGGYMRGIFTDIGISTDIQGHVFITSMCIVGMSILGFFESRYNTVVKGNRVSIFKAKSRLFYMGMHYFYALMFTLPLFYNQPDQMEGRKFVKRTLPCVPESIIDDPDFHLWLEEPMLYAIHYGLTALVISLEVIYYFVHTALFLSSTKAKSQKTHKMQVQFFIALTIQIAIPLVIVIFPIAYLITAFITLNFDQMYNNIALNFIALHGVASSSVMLIVHKPYRDAVVNLLRLRVIWAKCHRRSGNTVGDASLMVVSSIVNIQRDRRASNRI